MEKTRGLKQSKLTLLQELVLEYHQLSPESISDLEFRRRRLHWPIPDGFGDWLAYFQYLHKECGLIVIFGDYDCDGMTGSATLARYLSSAGFHVKVYLPTRHEGYGLNADALNKFVAHNAQLVITVDCGVSNRELMSEFRQLMFLVTDHHTVPDLIPEGENILGILHPKVLNIPETANLAGAGVAYWLTQLLSGHFLPTKFDVSKDAQLAALGTIGDMTPLMGLNRHLVQNGLLDMQEHPLMGISAILNNLSGQKSGPVINEELVNFQINPRLNAAGRMENPRPALDLLLSRDPRRADLLAKRLNQYNDARKELTREISDACNKKLQLFEDTRVIVLAGPWAHGVLGLVASDLSNTHSLPSFVMALEGDVLKGSSRSVPGLSVIDALKTIAPDVGLKKFGGHPEAAGWSIPAEKYWEFQLALEQYFDNKYAEGVRPKLDAPMQLDADKITLDDIYSLDLLRPFGQGFKMPKLQGDVTPIELKNSSDGKHWLGKTASMNFAAFGMGDKLLRVNKPIYADFSLGIDRFSGKPEPQIRIERILA